MIDSETFDVAVDGAGAAVPLLTGVDLMLLGRELPAVFDILVTTATGSIQLRCHALLRITPQRRIVARANFAGACVIAKFFIGARASVDREWEERGHVAFVRSGVATPQIINRGSLIGVGFALLFECVDVTHPATEADLMSMMPIVAQLHTHGVVQNNLHLGNVLRSAHGWLLIDGSGVSGMGDDAPLPRRASVRNLALLLSQFGVRAEGKFVTAWHAYAVARGFTTIDADAGELIAAVRRARRARVRAQMRAVLRDNADFVVQRRFGRRVVCERGLFRGAVASLIEEIDAEFGRATAPRSRATAVAAHSAVAHIYVAGEPMTIERYAAPGRLTLWRRRRARRAWRNAHRLRLLGIETPHPVALIERWFGPSYVLLRDVGGIDLGERIANGHIQPLVALFADLARAGLVHGDTRSCNFIDVAGTIHLGGLADMRAPLTRWGLSRGVAHDLERFVANWSDSATIRAALNRAFVALWPDGAALRRRLIR